MRTVTWPSSIVWPEAESEPGPEFVEHELSGFCWCQPLVETDAVTGDHLFIHRQSIDSPHIEGDR